MTTILTLFFIALLVSNFLVPVAKWIGVRCGALDMPDSRKVHTEPIPRTGGLAIFVGFWATICISKVFLATLVTDLVVWNQEMLFLLSGALVCFGVGLYDDFKRLGPKVKLLFQIAGASLAYIGGARIGDVSFFEVSLVHFPILSYSVSVFWFLLFMNAVNLIDGLDGLAGGIVVFTSVVMVILSILRIEYLSGFYFSILAGSVLGFLRYNFNPASIFLGDGGSYFLGYAIAGLSILGSAKAQTSAAVAMPLLALGVPLFDTILSPIRRFMIGKKMFRPDKGHVHHRLIEMGMTARKAVLVIYGLTFGLCVFAMVITNIRDERAGLFLIILGCGVAVLVRKLGYFEYIASDKFYGWFQDMSDQTGFRHDRRSFLSHQVDIAKADNMECLWKCLEKTAVFLELDFLELTVSEKTPGGGNALHVYSFGELRTRGLDWDSAMHIILPLASKKAQFGSLAVSKNIIATPLTPFTLRRIEQLRRTVVEVLERIGQGHGEVNVYGKTG